MRGESVLSAPVSYSAGEYNSPARLALYQSSARPDQAETWLEMGMGLLSRGDYQAAESTFRAALRLSPACDEARIGLARIAWYRGDAAGAEAQLADMDDHPGAEQLRQEIEAAAIASPDKVWHLDIANGAATIFGSIKTWAGERFADARPLHRRSVSGPVSAYSLKFERKDVYFQTRLNHQLGNQAKAYVSVGGGLDSGSRPRAALLGGVSMPASEVFQSAPPVFLSLDGRIASYASGEIARTSLALNTSFFGDRLKLVSRGILLSDERDRMREGFALDGEMQAGEASKLVLSYADAPEISGGVTIDVISTSLALRHDLTDDMDVSLSASHEEKRAY